MGYFDTSMNKTIKVLVAEDNEGDFSLLKMATASLPYTVEIIHFKNGLELVDFVKANSIKDYHFILLDLNMPVLDGYDVLQFFNKNSIKKLPPIIILSSSIKEEDIEYCYELGANGYITKPISIQEFQKNIQSTFNFWGKLNIASRQ